MKFPWSSSRTGTLAGWSPGTLRRPRRRVCSLLPATQFASLSVDLRAANWPVHCSRPGEPGSLRRLNFVDIGHSAHLSTSRQAGVDQVVSAHTAGGRPGELGRLVGQAWQAQVASVPYSLSRLDDRRGWVTKSTLCARAPSGRGGVVVHRDPSALLDGLTFVPLTALSHPQTRRALDRGDNGVRRILPVLKLRPLTRL